MREREEACKGCRFYKPPRASEHADTDGLCRVRGPTTYSAIRWPAVAHDDWCGEWQAIVRDTYPAWAAR